MIYVVTTASNPYNLAHLTDRRFRPLIAPSKLVEPEWPKVPLPPDDGIEPGYDETSPYFAPTPAPTHWYDRTTEEQEWR